jgi:hypothetical protein
MEATKGAEGSRGEITGPWGISQLPHFLLGSAGFKRQFRIPKQQRQEAGIKGGRFEQLALKRGFPEPGGHGGAQQVKYVDQQTVEAGVQVRGVKNQL